MKKRLKLALYSLLTAGLISLLCFALLQTRWAQETIANQLRKSLQKAGLNVAIHNLEGKSPFVWKVERIEFHLPEGDSLILREVELTWLPLPLFNGTLALKSLTVQDGILTSHFKGGSLKETVEMLSFKIRETFDRFPLPFTLSIRQFCVQRGSLNGFLCSLLGKARVRKDGKEFFLSVEGTDALLQPIASLRLEGSSFNDEIKLHYRTRLPFVLELDLFGPWKSWKGVFTPFSHYFPPLKGRIKSKPSLQFTFLDVAYPCRIAATFSLTSLNALYFDKLTLASDLFRAQGKGLFSFDREKSKVTFSYALPDLSLLCKQKGSGRASGKGFFGNEHFRLSFHTDHLTTYNHPIGKVEGVLSGIARKDLYSGTLHFLSEEKSLPFQGSLSFALLPYLRLDINRLHIGSSDATADGHIHCDLQSHLLSGDLFVRCPKIEQILTPFYQEPIEGSFGASCHLFPEGKLQGIQFSAIAERCRYEASLAQSISVSGEYISPSEGSLSIDAEGIFSPEFELDHFMFDTEAKGSDWEFSLAHSGNFARPLSHRNGRELGEKGGRFLP